MTLPLALLAFLLLGSGSIKLKAAQRVDLGVPWLVVAEMLAGIGILSAGFAGSLSPGQGLAVLVGGVALVVVSSLQVGKAVRRQHRLRNATEGTRLANYLKYLSAQDPPAE